MDNETYFNQMNLPQSEKESRIAMCNELSSEIYSDFKEEINSDIKTAGIITLLLFKFNILDGNEITITKYTEYINSVLKGNIQTLQSNIQQDILNILNMVIYDATNITETTSNGSGIEYMKSEKRADFIARNITNKYNNMNNHSLAVKNGAKYHIWNTETDGRVRNSHKDANRQKKKINEPFNVNGFLTMYPMDDGFGASADEILNCRCTETFSRN